MNFGFISPIFWTASLTILTILLNYIISRTVILVFISKNLLPHCRANIGNFRSIRELRELVKNATLDNLKKTLDDILQDLDETEKSNAKNKTWGIDLSFLAFSLDFVIFSIWKENRNVFPFLKDSWCIGPSQDMSEVFEIWLVIMCIHLIMFLLAIIFNHMHISKVDDLTCNLDPKLRGIKDNNFFISSFLIGLTSLFTVFYIITYKSI